MFCSKRFHMIGIGAWVMFLALIFTGGTLLEAHPVVDPPVLDQFIYLPTVSSPPTSIGGKVVQGGVPAFAQVRLVGQGYNGGSLSTNADGSYRFSGLAPLDPGNSYTVVFDYHQLNTLQSWDAAPILTLKKGDNITLPTFDIANVVLTDPAEDATVALPYTFRWTPRPGNPDETYRLVLYNSIDGKEFVSQNVGYSGEYTMQPQDLSGFPLSSTLQWYVRINKADGSSGLSTGNDVIFREGPATTIAGKVMNGGAPQVNGLVDLRGEGAPGSGSYSVAYTNPDSTGSYTFSDVPLLRPGYSYFVRFTNQGSNTLSRWETAPIFDLAQGQRIDLPAFDVAPLILTDPAPDASVALPYTFRWTPRPGHSDETYRFVLNETTLNNQFTGPSVGYAGAYTLQSVTLPTYPGVPSNFIWSIDIYGADGSRGYIAEQRKVSFTNLAQ